MDAQTAIGEPDASWSENTTPGSDDIEEIVRQPFPPVRHQFVYRHTIGPRSIRPIRRRLRPEEARAKSHQTFAITTMDSRRSMDGSEVSSSSAMTIVTSATSSCTDPWSSSGFVQEVDEDGDYSWADQDQDDLIVPKIEPIDDLDMADLIDMKDSLVRIPETPSSSTNAQGKRPRGRPRKHPKPTPESIAKVAKGRSKTGCITCRKRKKKCDETKPSC
jgi:hypothetical protein